MDILKLLANPNAIGESIKDLLRAKSTGGITQSVIVSPIAGDPIPDTIIARIAIESKVMRIITALKVEVHLIAPVVPLSAADYKAVFEDAAVINSWDVWAGVQVGEYQPFSVFGQFSYPDPAGHIYYTTHLIHDSGKNTGAFQVLQPGGAPFIVRMSGAATFNALFNYRITATLQWWDFPAGN